MSAINLSAVELRRAADIAERIESLNAELSAILGGEGGSAPASDGSPKSRRRQMSAAGRARIAAAARARWAKVKAQGGSSLALAGTNIGNGRKTKRTMSAAARAKIAAAARARWAKVRMAKNKR